MAFSGQNFGKMQGHCLRLVTSNFFLESTFFCFYFFCPVSQQQREQREKNFHFRYFTVIVVHHTE